MKDRNDTADAAQTHCLHTPAGQCQYCANTIKDTAWKEATPSNGPLIWLAHRSIGSVLCIWKGTESGSAAGAQ